MRLVKNFYASILHIRARRANLAVPYQDIEHQMKKSGSHSSRVIIQIKFEFL